MHLGVNQNFVKHMQEIVKLSVEFLQINRGTERENNYNSHMPKVRVCNYAFYFISRMQQEEFRNIRL